MFLRNFHIELMENNRAWLEIRVDTVLVVSLSLRKGHKLQRVWRSLIFQPGGELLLAHSPASPLNYLLCAIRRTHASVRRPFPSLFLLSTSKVSTLPICQFYIYQLFIIPSCSSRPCLPIQLPLLCKLRFVSWYTPRSAFRSYSLHLLLPACRHWDSAHTGLSN